MKHKKIIENGVYIPSRMCVACRNIVAKSDLIRIVKDSEGQVVVDFNHKTSGRGAYICKNKDCVLKAQKIRALERALKCAVAHNIYEECCIFEQ